MTADHDCLRRISRACLASLCATSLFLLGAAPAAAQAYAALYEYACHEGSYSFASMLGGQREADRQMSALRLAAEKSRR